MTDKPEYNSVEFPERECVPRPGTLTHVVNMQVGFTNNDDGTVSPCLNLDDKTNDAYVFDATTLAMLEEALTWMKGKLGMT